MSAVPAPLMARTISQVLGMSSPKGLEIDWLSTSTFRVRSGSFRTRDGLTSLALAADTTVDTAVNGAAGMDRKTLTGTATGTSGTKAVTGSGTSFLTEFGTRTLTGTASSSGTTVTFANGDPLKDRPGIGDLIGTAAKGYERITGTDFSLGVGGATYTLTIANAFSSALAADTCLLIESPTFMGTGDSTKHGVDRIASATSLTTIDNLGANISGTCYAGTLYKSRCYYVWLLGDSTLRLSSQRTVPFASSTARRLGFMPMDSSALIQACGPERKGNLFSAKWTAGSASTTTETTATRLATNGTIPICDAVARFLGVSLTLTNTATDESFGIGLVLPGTSYVIPYLMNVGTSTVDNGDVTGVSRFFNDCIDVFGDGGYYAYTLRNTGSGGTLTMSLGTYGATIEL